MSGYESQPNPRAREEQAKREVEQKYNEHKNIMKKLKASSKAYQRISKAYFEIKSSMLVLSQILESQFFNGISNLQSKVILEHICNSNISISDHCQQFATQLFTMQEFYNEQAKQRFDKYQEERDNFDHYVRKVGAMNQHEERERYERNKQKLRDAKTDYQSTAKNITAFLHKINEESKRMWENSFIGFVSSFARAYGQSYDRIKSLLSFGGKQVSEDIIDDDDCFLGSGSVISTMKQIDLQQVRHDVERYLIKNHVRPVTSIKDLFQNRGFNAKVSFMDVINTKQESGLINKSNAHRQSRPPLANHGAPAHLHHSKSEKVSNLDKAPNNFQLFEDILSQQIEKKQPKKVEKPNLNNIRQLDLLSVPTALGPRVSSTKSSNHKVVGFEFFDTLVAPRSREKQKSKEINLLDL